MKAIDQVLVEGQGEQFALLAPEVINDYVETLGKPCQNPLGYTAGSLILAKDLEGVQRMFKVTANISSSQNVVEGTNVERKKLEDLFDGINTELGSVKNALGNEVATRAANGAHNLFNINDNVSVSDARIANNGFTNYTAMPDTTFRFQLWARNSSDSTIATLVDSTINSTGKKSFNITIPSGTVMLVIAHYNTSLISIKNRVNLEPGDYIISFDVNGYNPSTVGGLDVRNIMIRKATDANADFEPFAMTNQQLTAKTIQRPILNESATLNTANTWLYTNLSFTLTKTSLVNILGRYAGVGVRGMAISASSTAFNQVLMIVEDENDTSKNICGKLEAGTWYIWAKYAGTGLNRFDVSILEEYYN